MTMALPTSLIIVGDLVVAFGLAAVTISLSLSEISDVATLLAAVTAIGFTSHAWLRWSKKKQESAGSEDCLVALERRGPCGPVCFNRVCPFNRDGVCIRMAGEGLT